MREHCDCLLHACKVIPIIIPKVTPIIIPKVIQIIFPKVIPIMAQNPKKQCIDSEQTMDANNEV